MNNGWLIFGILLVVLFGGWACRNGAAAGETKRVEEQGVNTTDTTAADTTANLLDGVLDLDAWTSEPIEIDPRDTINIPPAVRAAAEGWYGGDLFLKYRGTMPDGIEVYGVAPAVTGLFVGWLPVFLWKEGRVVGIYGQGVSGKTLKKVERKPCTVTVPKKMTGQEERRFRKSVLGLAYEGWTLWYIGRKANGTRVYGAFSPWAPRRKMSMYVVLWSEEDSIWYVGHMMAANELEKLVERVRIPLAVQEAADRWAGGQFQPLERYGVTPDGTEVYVVKMPEGSLTGLPELFIWKRGRVRNVSGLAALALLRQAEEE